MRYIQFSITLSEREFCWRYDKKNGIRFEYLHLGNHLIFEVSLYIGRVSI